MAKIIYEPHPVNAARKAKLQAQGYKIIDAIFAPAGTPIHQELDDEVAPLEVELEVVAEQLADLVLEEAPVEYEAEEVSFKPSKRGRPKKD